MAVLPQRRLHHATSAAATTARARDSVSAGLGTINELDHAMNSARNSAQKINQIIARINELSFQTNLLALNAAVEAARAGSAGAGFAVVADEVRGLASRCAEAARETTELIEQSARDTATAISKSDELAGRFKGVSRNIHEVNEIVSMISTNFRQQASSISEISHSVAKQRKIAQSIAAEALQTASTAQSMEDQWRASRRTCNGWTACWAGALEEPGSKSRLPSRRRRKCCKATRGGVHSQLMNRLSILVVDDRPEIRNLLRLWLESDSHTVACADGGNDALKILKKSGHDLVVTDVLMPDGVGGSRPRRPCRPRKGR